MKVKVIVLCAYGVCFSALREVIYQRNTNAVYVVVSTRALKEVIISIFAMVESDIRKTAFFNVQSLTFFLSDCKVLALSE